jgi:hypothetical protein
MIWSDIDFHPPERKLRVFAGLFLGAMTSLAMVVVYTRDDVFRGGLLGVVGALAGVAGFFKPGFVRPLYVGMMIASFPASWVTSHVLFMAVYFGLFTPLAVVFRCLGRDALQLRSRSACSTYLEPLPATRDKEAYFRLY